ncbi:hypothetical protein C0Q70_09887 [Pomacea canaliculata]|uniref:Uncharacterized protein n=1 Tax=Pomacea canaliculata TaxID=400727 RepID=A0A2T7PB15_POMCA|nr:hypothetical protein C0Q70_09887 [Pomacea canaliculata]
MTAAAVVAASAPKRHGFSIESLIGRRDDSPGRRQNSSSSSGGVCRPFEERGLPDRERARDRDFSRGSVVSKEVPGDHGSRDGERRVADRAREGRSSSLSPRLGTASPSSTDDERSARVPSPAHSASPSGGLGLDKSLSPETENRFGPWSREDFKHLLVGSGAFGPHHGHHAGHHHHHQHAGHALAAAAAGGDHEGANLYQQPLRVCNRSLAAAMNTLMGPHQGLGALPVNPLLYSLQRDIAHHQSAHSLLAARYSGFMHPRYPTANPAQPPLCTETNPRDGDGVTANRKRVFLSTPSVLHNVPLQVVGERERSSERKSKNERKEDETTVIQ